MGGVVPLVKFLEKQKLSAAGSVQIGATADLQPVDAHGAGNAISAVAGAVQTDPIATGDLNPLEQEQGCETGIDDERAPGFTQDDVDAAYARGRQEAAVELQRQLETVAQQVEAAVQRAVQHTSKEVVDLCAGIVDQLGHRYLLQHLLDRVAEDVSACIAGSAVKAANVSGDPELARLVAERLREGGIEVAAADDATHAETAEGCCLVAVDETVLEVRHDEWLRDLEAALQ
jgi:flagellar biosynthesis/type III secretory pathway protein FliH